MNDNLHFARGIVIFVIGLCIGVAAVFGIGMVMSKISDVKDENIAFGDNDGIREDETVKKTAVEKAEETTTENEVIINAEVPQFDDSLWANSVQYNVGKGKTYSTISAALDRWAADGYPVATVNIANGEYGGYDNFIRPYSGKTIAFIGESRDGVIIKSTSGIYADTPVIVANSNVQIRNMTIIADHSKNPDFTYKDANYPHARASAIHVDGGDNTNRKGFVYIENVKAVSYQSAAIVANLIPDSTVRIENCECISYTDKEVKGKPVAMLKYGAITCTKSEPDQYSQRSTERLELVNVKATAQNTEKVVYLKNGIPEENFDLLAYKTELISPLAENEVGAVTYDKGEGGKLILDKLSKDNNCETLNYKEK